MFRKAFQQIRVHRRRIAIGCAISAGVGLAAWSPRLFGPVGELTFLEKVGYDFVHWRQSRTQMSQVQIIEMDQRSFRSRGQETASLWDRGLHADLLQKLSRDGARVVVFDVLFDKAAQPEVDAR